MRDADWRSNSGERMGVSRLDAVSARAIEADLRFVSRMALEPSFAETRPILMTAATPYLALILFESISCLGLELDQIGLSESAKTRLRACRNEAKILTHSTSIESMLSEAQGILEAHNLAFKTAHEGRRFAALWKWMQTDFGLYFRKGQFVTNTFTLHQDVALTTSQIRAAVSDEGTVGPLLFGDAREFGQVLGAIADALGVELLAPQPHLSSSSDRAEGFWFRDVKSSTWLGHAQRLLGRPELPLVYLLLNVLSRTRTAIQLSSLYAWDNPWEQLKINLLYGFHAIGSIQRIVGHEAKNPCMTSDARSELRSVLGMPSVKAIRSMRILRNFAVHYGLDAQTSQQLNGAVDFDLLVDATTQFESVQAALGIVDEGLAIVAAVLSKHFDLSAARSRPL